MGIPCYNITTQIISRENILNFVSFVIIYYKIIKPVLLSKCKFELEIVLSCILLEINAWNMQKCLINREAIFTLQLWNTLVSNVPAWTEASNFTLFDNIWQRCQQIISLQVQARPCLLASHIKHVSNIINVNS